ncbi:MAG: TRAP transporter TatT component family protein [Elusimicrobiota bacterium]|nr:MAG: TRAP transporter TatT component family protein [Elusimicrobiota bacterium]
MRNGFLLALLALTASACASIDRIALRSTAVMLERGRGAALDEPDWQLGREAMASQLKLVETLLASDPESRPLRRLAAEGFGGYSFLFVEDGDPARAKGLYLRGRDRALASLALNEEFKGLASRPLDEFEPLLKKAKKEDVPDLYWAGFGWAGWVNLSKDDAAALADLPKAVALMRRVYELDPTFQFGGTDLFFGVYYASRPPILGGDPGKAKTHFEWAHKITRGAYLMTHVLNARWYAVAVQDRELYKQLLSKVLASPSGVLPEARLTDEAAKKKAAALLEKTDDFF